MTDYEDFNTYNEGDTWEYNSEMERLFKDRVVKRTKANRPSSSDAPDEALFRATDERKLYRNDTADGWVEVGGRGTDSSPRNLGHFDNLNVHDSVQFKDASAFPSTDGEITNNNGTLAAHTDGEVRDIGIPLGVIVMWSGTVNDIPSGWTLCDGNGQAPDLRDRFVVGAGGSNYSAGDTGGADSVALEVADLPQHDHGRGTLSAASHDHGSGSLSMDAHSHSINLSAIGAHSHSYDKLPHTTVSVASGNDQTLIVGQSQENTPNTTTNAISISNKSTGGQGNSGISGTTSDTAPNVNGRTSDTGLNESHENRPPFYALAYIMKT